MSKKHQNRAIALKLWRAQTLGVSMYTRKKEDKKIYERILDALKRVLVG